MGKGSGGTRSKGPSHRVIEFPSYAIGQSMLMIGKSAVTDILRSFGDGEDNIKKAFLLLNNHGGNSYQQEEADPQLYELINDKGSSVGKTLRDIAAINEAQFLQAMAKRPEAERDITVYRGGARKDVEAWTRDPEGADTGSGRIQVGYSSSIRTLLKTHYMVGGISQGVGAPGEAEVLFIRRRKK